MKIRKILKIAFLSIMKNKLRSLLTSLGIIIGVCSVIVMVGIGQGSQKNIEDNIASMGTNLIMVRRPSSRNQNISLGSGSRNTLTINDIAALKSSENIIGVSGSVRAGGSQIIHGSNNWQTTIEGVSSDYPIVRNWEIEEGSFFTDKDDKVKKKVVVIGQTVKEELFENESPIGKTIRINKVPVKIIGVLKEKGVDGRGNDQDDIILAPVQTVMKKMSGSKYLHMIFVSARDMESINETQEEVIEILRKSHKLKPGTDDDFSVFNQSEITEMASSTSKTLTLLLGAIAGVSLLVGGIGIMNIMLVSVTERTREIGIRLSIGAKSKDVMTQFLTEAITLSVSGGIIGITLSLIISYIIDTYTPLHSLIDPVIIMISFSFSAFVGVFFGYYPARKAANLNPIDALRYE